MKKNEQKPKISEKYYIPVWPGLIRDPKAKHYKKMGKAIWLFLNLLFSEHGNGTISKIKYETIHRNTGIPKSTIIKHMHRLKRKGYITMRTVEGRFLSIEIMKWKTQRQKEEKNTKLILKESIRNNRVIKKGNTARPRMETLDNEEL